ncbi:hypothetical protein [Alicyclobacillus sp. SO9]|uniref:hypothetical protein n=1 Tax=Alicyclobacillus sp. SO9 TaxID=2665646 RepID=UPI0018E79E4B|nr:hypothetical protein [Alicyclobacillus sp. SO9]QQE77740.1 hypothetical protein GI364_17650 [Alicyclobacillus sp. SO9]
MLNGKRFLAFGVTSILSISLTLTPTIAHASTNGKTVSKELRQASPYVNLSHLNSLHTTVPYPSSPLPHHSTVNPGTPLDVWWVYANLQSNGKYKRVGGGTYNSTANTWGQGEADIDDIARISVVYLRHYQIYHDRFSLTMARAALRTIMYMQINSGPHAGNFVNWIEPNGQPNLNPVPSEDTGSTFDWWAARSLWAMSEGYHVFRSVDPSFADALRTRMQLAIHSLGTQVSSKYGKYYLIHGYKMPQWLISDGSDASSVAMLGLVQYYKDTHNSTARKVLNELSTGVMKSQIRSAQNQWPYNAHMPWQKSIDMWEAWGNRQIMALAEAGKILRNPQFIQSAERAANSLYPHMIISFGPDNGWLPAPDNQTQISYGAESMIDSLLTLGKVTGNPTYAKEAGILGTWYEGNNRAHTVMYHPRTGITFDGINNDKTVNKNSGAESTLTGLLAMMNLESNPIARTYLPYNRVVSKTKPLIVDGSSGTPSNGASIASAPNQWSGDFLWRTGSFGVLVPKSQLAYTITVAHSGMYLIQLSYDKQQLPVGKLGVRVYADHRDIGTINQGGAGVQGGSPTPDYLWMHMLTKPVFFAKGTHVIRLAYAGAKGHEAKIDSIIVQPMIERETLQNSTGNSVTMSHNMLNGRLSFHSW